MDQAPLEQPAIVPLVESSRPPLNRFALPRTIYVYLALLIASYVIPSLVGQVSKSASKEKYANAQAGLTDSDFERYVTAETNFRTALASESGVKGSRADDAFTKTLTSFLGGKRDKLLRDCRSDYLALSATTRSPGTDRRVLILDNLLGLPLDERFIDRNLRPDLRSDGESTVKISGELNFWRSIYGTKRLSAHEVAIDEPLVRSMKLKFLEPRVLADMWRAAGNPTAALASEEQLHTSAAIFLRGKLIVSGIEVIAFLTGLVILILFLSAAISGAWGIVHRVATAPLHLLWGELLDVFVFYLGSYRFVSLCASLIIKAVGAEPNAHEILLLDALMQIVTGIGALVYLAAKAKHRGVTLAEVGLTIRGSLIREIVYGVAGYVATLPLMIIMALLSRQIFRHSTNTAPNPILPLMVGVHDPISRTLIFLMASLAAPFFEETFFRGALFTALRTRYGWFISALLSAMCFALVHPMQDWLPIFALGVSFATMREMRQSLVPSMTAHFLQNTVTFLTLSALFSS